MSGGRGRLGRWLERVIDADPRYICAVCDDRFQGRPEGVKHVIRCHPELADDLEVFEEAPAPAAEPVAVRTAPAAPTRTLSPTPLLN